MDILLNLPVIGFLLTYILPFAVILMVIVFIHEYGHYIVGRWCGIHADAFAVGFGKELLGWTDKRGTRWKICLLPLGGYVKFKGDADPSSAAIDMDAVARMTEEERKGAFPTAALWKRVLTVIAGPMANFILSTVIFAGTVLMYGYVVNEARISEVLPDSAAEAAGFEPGDRILGVDGAEIDGFADLQEAVSLSNGREMQITVEREGDTLTLLAVPTLQEREDGFGGKVRVPTLGVRSVPFDEISSERVYPGIGGALWYGIERTGYIIKRSLVFIYDAIAGKEDVSQIRGVIGMAEASGKTVEFGLGAVIIWTALLSASIGLINLFPIPVLDGGHLVFYAIEAVRGKPLGERAQEIGMSLGLFLILMLMFFALYNDVVRLFG